jgi:5-methylcytosine-specific restriction protein B
MTAELITTSNAAEFNWIPFYEEFADKLLSWRDSQEELIGFLAELRAQGLKVTPLDDKDENGRKFQLTEIDPFTFFGSFNRGVVDETRIKILQAIKNRFAVVAETPSNFSGIPLLNNLKSWYFAFKSDRLPGDIDKLWDIFAEALKPSPLSSQDFAESFDKALTVRCTNINLTIGLFWIRPRVFLNLDGTIREYLKIKLPTGGLSFKTYLPILESVKGANPDFATLSHAAYLSGKKTPPPEPPIVKSPVPPPIISTDTDYWMVGAYWDDADPKDQTVRFLAEGVWVNGYDDKFIDEVKSMKVGDKIAIKASKTQRLGLPFDSGGKTASVMLIKATGTIVKNLNDGKTVEVEWDSASAEPRNWYFYTGRSTVWRLRKDDEFAQHLISFVFLDVPQDYPFFVEKWYGKSPEVAILIKAIGGDMKPYAVADLIDEGVFLTEEEIHLALRRLATKKNLILQGAPGVGKTFVAKRLAYALMESADDSRIRTVQFHPSYSYEDFIRGYRPTNEAGKFELMDGSFWQLCNDAAKDSDRKYVLVIDEINRGNLSQVFGELFMLLEADKRGKRHEVTPLYRRTPEESFFIPENLYVIGTMNIADRSLALVDYALRRRFSFFTLCPKFDSEPFRKWMKGHGAKAELIQLVATRMQALNTQISGDKHLGPAFQIGHSFFCPKEKDDFTAHDKAWFHDVVETEIIPLLEEYWHDSPEKVNSATEELRG